MIYYTVQAGGDDTPNIGVIDEIDIDKARERLDAIYGNTGSRTIATISYITKDKFNELKRARGKDLTHRA